MENKRAVVVVAVAVSAFAALWLAGRRVSSSVVVEGTVYDGIDARDGPGASSVGAVISNDWDDSTTTTDSAGHYAIRVRRVAQDEWIVVRARLGSAVACQQITGGVSGPVDLFLDGGYHGSQQCRD